MVNIEQASAHWLTPSVIAWRFQHDEGNKYMLVASETGDIEFNGKVC
jgi:hypothetical protein